MLNFLAKIRCILEGKFKKHVRINGKCSFNRRRLICGLQGISGCKQYPVSITDSKICGNVSIQYGSALLGNDINTSASGQVIIGRFSSINSSKIYAGDGNISVGSFCSILDTSFLNTGHNLNSFTTYYLKRHLLNTQESIEQKGNIVVENDVWIGAGAIVLSGVTIGTGAVIGAGSIVTHSVEPYAVYAGVPAKLIKYRFPAEIRKRLLATEWWLADCDKLRSYALIKDKPIEEALMVLESESASHLEQ